MMQVHLGYVDSYTLVPPRGVIVASRHRDWLTPRELQTAFLAGRVILTDPQVLVLRNLVKRFAATVASLNPQPENSLTNINLLAHSSPHAADVDSMKAVAPEAVLGIGQSLSSEWLRRYLLHLRLTKRTQSAAGAKLPESQRNRQLAWALTSIDYKQVGEKKSPKKDRNKSKHSNFAL